MAGKHYPTVPYESPALTGQVARSAGLVFLAKYSTGTVPGTTLSARHPGGIWRPKLPVGSPSLSLLRIRQTGSQATAHGACPGAASGPHREEPVSRTHGVSYVMRVHFSPIDPLSRAEARASPASPGSPSVPHGRMATLPARYRGTRLRPH